MLDPWAVAVFVVLGAVAFVASLWFAVRLHILTRGSWRRSAMGRHSMTLALVLAGLLAATSPVFRPVPGRWVFLLGGTAALTGVLVWRAILLETMQKRGVNGKG